MKLWHSVSARLTLTLLTITLGSLAGLFFCLDIALKRFFIKDAQAVLQQHATALAVQVPSQWDNVSILKQFVNMTSQQTSIQVVVFDAVGHARVEGQWFGHDAKTGLPSDLISNTLAGQIQIGQFQVTTDLKHPRWLYSVAPIQNPETTEIIGAVYVAMPLRRPRQFAEQVKGLVMGVALLAVTFATVAGLLLSRTLTQPLKKLRQQAQSLQAGDYTARSAIEGQDELAQLSHLLDRMASQLMETLNALQAQEAARRELVANVSHDLRTPLAALRVELEAVLDGVVEGRKSRQYLQRACRETDYLARLVEQLSLLAKADAKQLQVNIQAVSAIAIAQECLFRMQPCAIQVGLELELSTESPVNMVHIDPELTGQVVLNLLDNAIKYAPNSKVVHLKILPPIEKDQRHFVPLQVQDMGKGMSTDILQRVTERFYRGDNSRPRGGLGLGLAIAQHICQLQGGSISVASQLGQGTTVTLFLPTATQPLLASA